MGHRIWEAQCGRMQHLRAKRKIAQRCIFMLPRRDFSRTKTAAVAAAIYALGLSSSAQNCVSPLLYNLSHARASYLLFKLTLFILNCTFIAQHDKTCPNVTRVFSRGCFSDCSGARGEKYYAIAFT